MKKRFYISVASREGYSTGLSKWVEGDWEDALKAARSLCYSNPEYIIRISNPETGEEFEYGMRNKPGYIEDVP
jgi:hypothetical protein